MLQGDEGDAVVALACSPNGERLLSASEKGWISYWDLRNSDVLTSLQIKQGCSLICVAFAADGTPLAAVARDGADFQLINMFTNLKLFQVHEPFVAPPVLSPDASMVAIAHYGMLAIYDVALHNTTTEDGKRDFPFDETLFRTPQIAFSHDNTQLAVVSAGTIYLHDLRLKTPPRAMSIDRCIRRISQIEFSSNDDILIIATPKKSVFFHCLKTDILLREIAPEPWVSTIAFSRDNKYFLSTADNRDICINDAQTGRSVQAHGYSAAIRSAIFSADSRKVFSGLSDGRILCRDIAPPDDFDPEIAFAGIKNAAKKT